MDYQEFAEQIQLMELLEQPGFLLRDGVLAYQNPAFESLGIVTGTPLEKFFGVEQLVPAGTEPSEQFAIIAGRRYIATIRAISGGVLVLLRPDEAANSANLLSRLVSVQREALQTMYTYGVRMIHRTDGQAQEDILQEQASFLQGYHQMRRALDNLDLYQQLISGRRKLHPEKVDFCAYFKQLTQKAAWLLAQAGLTLHTNLPEQEQSVVLDTVLVETAFWNLLANAGSNAPDGEIRLRVICDGEYLDLEAENNGKLPESKRIFSKKQIPLESDLLFTGAGIGIPLLHEIVKLHGGRLIPVSGKQCETRIALRFSVREAGEAMLHQTLCVTDVNGGADPGLLGLSVLLPSSCYLPDEILG